jgi:hypothetical protein
LGLFRFEKPVEIRTLTKCSPIFGIVVYGHCITPSSVEHGTR